MVSSQSKEDCLLVPLQLVDWINTADTAKPFLLGLVLVVDDGDVLFTRPRRCPDLGREGGREGGFKCYVCGVLLVLGFKHATFKSRGWIAGLCTRHLIY